MTFRVTSVLPPIPHSKPTLPVPGEWDEVTRRLAPGWAAGGPCVSAFARQAAEWLGATGGVAVNSGTSALHLALLAAGVGPGSDVLIPAYCCAAVLNAVHLAGAAPVLVDAEAGGFNLCPEDAAHRLTPRSAAVVVAHMFGRPAPLAPFLNLGIPVIEDCAQSIGASEAGRPTGSRGAVAIASFYATKVVTTGHGGLAATSNPERLAILRDLVEYDERDDWRPRFNYELSDLPAALGLWQLERLPRFLARRQALAHYYDAELEAAAGHPAALRPGSICYRYLLRVADADETIRTLGARGVEAKRPVYWPLHHYLGGEYPHAQAAHERLVSIPLYPSLTDAEAERVAAAAREVVGLARTAAGVRGRAYAPGLRAQRPGSIHPC